MQGSLARAGDALRIPFVFCLYWLAIGNSKLHTPYSTWVLVGVGGSIPAPPSSLPHTHTQGVHVPPGTCNAVGVVSVAQHCIVELMQYRAHSAGHGASQGATHLSTYKNGRLNHSTQIF